MKNITQFLLMLTLSFYIAFAPAVAYADEVTDKINKLQIDLQKRVGDKWTLSPRNKSVGAGVEIGVSQSYPVTATTTATTAAGATRTSTATLTAEKIGSKIFTPTTANIAKRFGMGVAQGMVAMALYDLLKKSVNYVLDPANNRVIINNSQYVNSEVKAALGNYSVSDVESAKVVTQQVFQKWGGNRRISQCLLESNAINCYWYYPGESPNGRVLSYSPDSATPNYVSLDTLAQRSQDIANNPTHKDVATAQSGMQTVVGDMINNNEIDNSYFNDSSISNDTYNDVTNNYVTNNITNQYPSVSVPTQAEMAQAAANGQSSVTKTTQNANGTTTTTTTNFNTTNNNTTTNNTYNITNITVNNPVSAKDDAPASTPASTPTPTASTPASTPKPTDSKPFELPPFCSWAKPVCDFIDWVKKDPEKPADDNTPLVKDDNQPGFNIDDYANKPYVQFSGECPAPPVFNVFGGQIVFPMDIICKGCEQMSWVFVAFAWLRAVMIVFFASKG